MSLKCLLCGVYDITTMFTFSSQAAMSAPNSLPQASKPDATFDGGRRRLTETPLPQRMKQCCGNDLPESHSEFPRGLVKLGQDEGSNALVSAVHAAWSDRFPLVLSPDIVWLAIAQGFSHHVSMNPKSLAQCSGDESLPAHSVAIREDEFIKGTANPWQNTFHSFSTEMGKDLSAALYSLLSSSFSTTGSHQNRPPSRVFIAVDKIGNVAIAGEQSHGIESVLLQGMVGDWKELRDRAFSLARYELQWWIDALEPILDQFVSAASGTVNETFWRLIYNSSPPTTVQGSTAVGGWITYFFPYTSVEGRLVQNAQLQCKQTPPWTKTTLKQLEEMEDTAMLCLRSIPPGVSSVPFTWRHCTDDFSMRLHTGFMGVSQDPDSLALQPEIGWAITDDVSSASSHEW